MQKISPIWSGRDGDHLGDGRRDEQAERGGGSEAVHGDLEVLPVLVEAAELPMNGTEVGNPVGRW